MRIDTLFLDAGGVLVFPNWTRIGDVLAHHGVEIGASRLAAAEPLAKLELDLGIGGIRSLNDRERGWLYFNLVLRHAGIGLSSRTDAALDELNAYHARSNLWETVPEDVFGSLERLRLIGLKLIVVSNANGTLDRLFERVGLMSRVDMVLDSHEEGVEKPDPRFFRIALDRAGASAETTLHAGDLYHVDVVGARAAGLRTVLVDPSGLYNDYSCEVVSSLGVLAGKLEGQDRMWPAHNPARLL
jgi:putative hydrolase of the HAD superfamily